MHFGALPIATVRPQTGLAPGGPIGKIAFLSENHARRGELRPDGPKIRPGGARPTVAGAND